MWWFLKKAQTRVGESAGNPRLQTEEQLLAQAPDMSRLDEHDVAIKIWLPELVAWRLKWVADYEGLSQSRWVRDRLLAYVYGRVAVLAHYIRTQRAAEEFFEVAVFFLSHAGTEAFEEIFREARRFQRAALGENELL